MVCKKVFRLPGERSSDGCCQIKNMVKTAKKNMRHHNPPPAHTHTHTCEDSETAECSERERRARGASGEPGDGGGASPVSWVPFRDGETGARRVRLFGLIFHRKRENNTKQTPIGTEFVRVYVKFFAVRIFSLFASSMTGGSKLSSLLLLWLWKTSALTYVVATATPRHRHHNSNHNRVNNSCNSWSSSSSSSKTS